MMGGVGSPRAGCAVSDVDQEVCCSDILDS